MATMIRMPMRFMCLSLGGLRYYTISDKRESINHALFPFGFMVKWRYFKTMLSKHFSQGTLELLHPKVEAYLGGLLPEASSLLKEMEAFGKKLNFPLVGPLVGRVLFQLASTSSAKRIFEMGSGYGYSAYWFAQALPGDGEVILTEGSQDLADQARLFLKRGNVEKKSRIEVGNALDIIERYDPPFDIIFIDIDKEDYPNAFEKAFPKLREGGLLIADNVLWSGRVVTGDTSPATEGIREFTRLIYQTQELFTTILPLRDGVSVSLKKEHRA